MTRWRYTHCGLTVDSELPLPELVEGWPPATRRPALQVRLGPPLPEPVTTHQLSVHGDGYRLLAPNAGRYEIGEGASIEIRPQPNADPAMLRLFLLGSAWGTVLHLRGELAFHGGVVLADDHGAMALSGPHAAGKSTLLAELLRRGHSLVSDDLARVAITPQGSVQVWPSVRRLKLSPAAATRNGWNVGGLEPEPPLGKLQVPWEGAFAHGPVELRQIYALQWGELGLSRLRGLAALQGLIEACTYRPQLVASAAEQARYWQACAKIVQHVEIWKLSRPREWSSVGQVVDLLQQRISAPRR